MTPAPHRVPRAFTLVELLVAIGIVGLLVSFLLPTLNKARDSARTVKCLSNLRQLALANSMYVSQWNGWAVPGLMGNNHTADSRVTWHNNNGWRRNINLPEWVPGDDQKDRAPAGLICPAAVLAHQRGDGAGGPINNSYGYNIRHVNYVPKPLIITRPTPSEWNFDTEFAGVKANRVRNPAEKIQFMDSMTPFVEPQNSNHFRRIDLYYDGEPTWTDLRVLVLCAYRHSSDQKSDNAKINIVFWDGHAATLSRGEVAAVRTPQDPSDVDGPVANRTPAWDRHWELGIN
jgi:prepilin-type N-terminal cleavage/methylation domain-containing protein/prepilin-type processing-associated H-X9-DG protein